MGSVAIDMTMSLDGYVAGPNDRPGQELGAHGGEHIFDWYTSGPRLPGDLEIAHPEPGANRDEVERLIAESGAFIFGRRTYDLTNGWGGSHPIDGMPLFILTHDPPPASEVPQGRSRITFVTDGIESAVRQAKAAAGDKQVKLQGASPGQQALVAGLVDELIIHLAPYLLGGGVRLFDTLPDGMRLEKLSVSDGPLATHLRYWVVQE